MTQIFEPGESVLVRSVDGGRVRRAIPYRFVSRGCDRFAFHVDPGNQGKWMGREGDNYLRRWMRGENPVDLTWSEEWRPPPDWEPLPLPAEWHVVDSGTSEGPIAPCPR